MQLFKNQSIRTKIIVLIVLVSTVNVIIGSIVQFYYEKNLYNVEIKEKLKILTDVIGDYNSATILFNDKKSALNYVSALKADKNIEKAIILLPDSSLFVEYKSIERPTIDKYNIRLFSDTSIFEDNLLIVNKPIRFEGETIASIRIEYSLIEYKKKQKQYFERCNFL